MTMTKFGKYKHKVDIKVWKTVMDKAGVQDERSERVSNPCIVQKKG